MIDRVRSPSNGSQILSPSVRAFRNVADVLPAAREGARAEMDLVLVPRALHDQIPILELQLAGDLEARHDPFEHGASSLAGFDERRGIGFAPVVLRMTV